MRKLKLLLKVCIFVGIFIGAEHLVRYAAYDDTSAISRNMLYELYHQEEGIDVLFAGASHVQLSFDTAVTDDIFEGNTFNAGSSAQSLQVTDALIREVADRYGVREVYVDLDYSLVMQDEVNLEGIYAVTDYMPLSLNKISCLLHATPESYYLNSFLPLGKGRTLAHSPQKILEILKKKSSYNYRHHLCGVDSYMGKGYVASYVKLTDGFIQQGAFKAFPEEIPEKQQDTLNDIIDFCRKRDIRLTFITTPMTDFLLKGSGDYDRYVSLIRGFLAGKGVSYYDFNLCRPEYLDLTDIGNYTDDNHLNRDGAAVFSKVFAEFFTGKIKESDLFYDSYAEKLKEQPAAVYGFLVEDDTEAGALTVTPVTNRADMDVRLAYSFDGGEETASPLYKSAGSSNKEDAQPQETGTVRITAYDASGAVLCSAACPYGSAASDADADRFDITMQQTPHSEYARAAAGKGSLSVYSGGEDTESAK